MKRILQIILIIILIGTIQPFFSGDHSYQKELIHFKRKLPKSFITLEYKPFVITGDLSKKQLSRITQNTIKRCTNALYNDFFKIKPDYLIKIYLFKDSKSYQYYSKSMFNTNTSSPYGYYLSSQRSLVMNIATGGGTLVHELVHALIDKDFPEVPAWFNEGLGSLFEACTCGKNIYGLTNWRLPGLQRRISEGVYVPLKEFISTSTQKFYQDKKGVHYAEARYFCMYMQEKRVLKQFYRLFRKSYNSDPTGLSFVEKAFKGKKIESIEKDWLRWVIAIRYER